jgi:hypothetical protein
MAQGRKVLDKIARNLEIQGEQVSRGSVGEVIVENGASDITISYRDASISPSMLGGVDSAVSPFLGIGQGNPGLITLRVQGSTGLADTLATAKAIKAMAMCAAHANDIAIRNAADSADLLIVRGHSDMIGVGQ